MESPFYRENLESILLFSGGAHTLTVSQVARYTGLKDNRTVNRHFPYFINGRISAETLAKCLCSAPPKGLKKQARRILL